jgi:Spy/CpxP family protein refolding chaperone
MKKLVLTALTTAICSLSIAASLVTPSIAQPSAAPAPAATPAARTNPQAQLIEQLKITKEQQLKLAKLEQSVRQQNIAVLTPSQKEQLIAANKQGKPPSFTLTPEQQTKLRAIYVAAIAKQDAILTTEQKRQLQELNQQYAPKPKPTN